MSFRQLPTPTARPVSVPTSKRDRKSKRRTAQPASTEKNCD